MKPESLEVSLAFLVMSGKKARLLGGGTDLLVRMKYGLSRPDTLISLKALPELSGITADNHGNIVIGAGVTLSNLAKNPIISEKIPVLKKAVLSVASKHIRNMATIGGNICLDTRCWYYNQSQLWREAREACHKTGGSVCHAIKGSDRCHAINSSDTAPILAALNASLRVVKKGSERFIPVKDFYNNNGFQHTVLAPEEIITSIAVPSGGEPINAVFIKSSSRKGLDFSIGSITAATKGNSRKCALLRLVVGSMTSAPLFLEKTAQLIIQSGLNEKSIEIAAETARAELGPVTNLFTRAGYKRDLIQALVKKCLNDLLKQMKAKRS
jgi:4-hydroxybenzoyl-CoA reductase beta subunit